jgi:hypothetical protein
LDKHSGRLAEAPRLRLWHFSRRKYSFTIISCDSKSLSVIWIPNLKAIRAISALEYPYSSERDLIRFFNRCPILIWIK